MPKQHKSTIEQISDFSHQSMLLREYDLKISKTNKLGEGNLNLLLFGLFGEVGSVMDTSKKKSREQKAYFGRRADVVEELGDVLWYFTTICRELGENVERVFIDAIGGSEYERSLAASDRPEYPISGLLKTNDLVPRNDALLELAQTASTLLSTTNIDDRTRTHLRSFALVLLKVIQSVEIPFAEILHKNVEKTVGLFVDPDLKEMPNFDSDFEEEEQIPSNFEIEFTQRKSGQCYLRWNGVFIGDPLTDNIEDEDYYRFHDVFHLAHAAILHWSPVFRALIKQKRKSKPDYDRNQDGGRSRVVEEGLTAWIFSRAKELNFFEDQTQLSIDLLKTVQGFVRGYEVEECPLSLWQRAILHGYKVFRQLKENNGGVVIGNRETRTICYRCLK